jgi:hypothetical protein
VLNKSFCALGVRFLSPNWSGELRGNGDPQVWVDVYGACLRCALASSTGGGRREDQPRRA